MAEQLTFTLPMREALGRGDFYVGPSNAVAVASVDNWRDWPEGKFLLIGPAGAGKTHLAHVWAAESGAAVVGADTLAGADIPALAARPAVVVEDAPLIAGSADGEAALFHLHNLLLAEGGRLLLTARSAPPRWGLELADLVSRMQATPSAALEPPDDALLAAVLVKLFADRQLAVSPQVVAFLVTRMERSLDQARSLVAAIDTLALEQARPVTRALAGEVLADMLDSGGDGAA